MADGTSSMQNVTLGKKIVGSDSPCYIIAEAGINHNGEIRLAKKLVKASAKAGADAVKFQTFSTASIASKNARKAPYQKKTSNAAETQYEMLKRLELSRDAFCTLADYAAGCGIEFLSSPFDLESADFLDSIGIAAFKIPSGELTNMPLLEKIGGFKKPVILSTGMASMNEIREGIDTLKRSGANDIILLHCVTGYPVPLESVNLRMIQTLGREFGLLIGFSDHTTGITAAPLARALGACIIEKHFTLDRHLPGPDHQASLEPGELSELITQVRLAEAAMGDGRKHIGKNEAAIRRVARKSLVAATDISRGSWISREMIGIKRPGTGIEPKNMGKVVGKQARKRIRKDTVLSWDMLQ